MLESQSIKLMFPESCDHKDDLTTKEIMARFFWENNLLENLC